jgi:hypothetical protein
LTGGPFSEVAVNTGLAVDFLGLVETQFFGLIGMDKNNQIIDSCIEKLLAKKLSIL